MYSFSCHLPYNYMMRQVSSYIRVLHASPNTPGVDVYANGDLIARNLRYREFTPYLRVPPGRYDIKVYPTGTTANAVISTNTALSPETIYTAAVIGLPQSVELLPVIDTKVPITSDKTNIRFVHLSPDAPALDVTLPDGTVLFPNVSYKDVTRYIPVTPGRFSIQARTTGTDNTILRVPNIVLRPGANMSFYGVGLARGNPGLQVLIPLDGSTYLLS